MKPRTKLAALGLAGLLAAAPVLNAAHAAGTTPPVKDDMATAQTAGPATGQTASADEQSQVLRTSDDIFNALRDIRSARLAIFNGDTEKAQSLTDSATADLTAAQKIAASLSIQTGKAKDTGDIYVPFDTSIALAEGFQPTDEKVAKIQEANQHIAAGDQKQAVETLRLANIDVVFNAALLPMNASVAHVTDAAKLMSDGSYYEANLALKAVEDSVVLDSYGISSLPVQGAAG